LKDKLGRLKLLQAVDQVIDGLEQQRKSLPERVEELRQEAAELEATFAKANALHQESVDLRNRRELDRTEEHDRAKKYEVRLRDIKNNREYQALLREIGFAKKAAAEHEEEIIRLKGEIEAQAAQVAVLRAQVETKLAEVAAQNKDTNQALKEVESTYKIEVKRRVSLLEEIPPDLMSRYNLVRKRTNLVVVSVGSGACHGCFMSLPPQLYNQVRRVDTLYTCPNCHRILFFEQQEEAVKV
jgi:uncharacterized protein